MTVSVCKHESNSNCVLLGGGCTPGRKGCVINARYKVSEGPCFKKPEKRKKGAERKFKG